MGAQHRHALDIGGARRPGDEIDRARPVFRRILPGRAELVAQPREGIFQRAGDLALLHDDDMVVGHEMQRGRRRAAGMQHQCSCLRYPCKSRRHADQILAAARAVVDLQHRSFTPGQGLQQRIGRYAQLRRQVMPCQIIGHLARHILFRRHAVDCHRQRFHLGDEQRDLFGMRDLRALRHQVWCAARDALGHSPRSRRIVDGMLQAGAQSGEDAVAGVHRAAPFLDLYGAMKVLADCGAGKSRPSVQPAASGNDANLPLSVPSIFSKLIATRVPSR